MTAEAGAALTARFAVAQLGARMHYAVPRIFHRVGRLETLYTDFAAVGAWQYLRPLPWRRLWSRTPEGIPAERIVQFPALALACALGQRMIGRESRSLRFWMETGRRFGRAVARHGFGGASAVYAYHSAALESFQAARERGLFCVLEQAVAPRSVLWRILADEAEAWPEWEGPAEPDSSGFAAREAAEWALADRIVCGSQFVADSLGRAGAPVERCAVVPYGVDWLGGAKEARGARSAPSASGAAGLRVLFCGAVGLRKGVPYLLDAARRLSRHRFQFRLVGAAPLPPRILRELARLSELTGSVPRPDMAAHYRWADVFVLPALCEGSATVCYEALAAGLPVITTPNAGSVVRDGVDGFLVPIRDAGAIASRLELLASSPELRAEMSRNAAARAREFTVAAYGERLLAALA